MATAHVDTRKFLSETKFYEGYSRYIEEQGRYEDWNEAVDRVIEMHENNYKEKNNELAQALRIKGLPTLMIYKKGEMVWRQSGEQDANTLIGILNEYI